MSSDPGFACAILGLFCKSLDPNFSSKILGWSESVLCAKHICLIIHVQYTHCSPQRDMASGHATPQGMLLTFE